MTKLEQLKAAYEALPKEDWRTHVMERDIYRSRVVTTGCCVLAECNGTAKGGVSQFIALAHNLMPQLLAAANHLAECQELLREYPWVYQECKRILGELK